MRVVAFGYSQAGNCRSREGCFVRECHYEDGDSNISVPSLAFSERPGQEKERGAGEAMRAEGTFFTHLMVIEIMVVH